MKAFCDSDETPFARLVASQVGMQHHEVVIGRKEFIDALPMFVRATDEPLADLASIPHERKYQERYVADVQISAGYMHSGYPIKFLKQKLVLLSSS